MQYNNPQPELSEQQIIRAQRKAVRSGSNPWGLAAAIGNIAISFIVLAVSMVAGIIKFDISAPVPMLIVQIVFSVLMMTVPFIIAASAANLSINNLIRIKFVRPGLFFPLIMVGLGGAMICNNLTNSFISIFTNLGLEIDMSSLELPESLWGKLLFLFTISVVPAIVEEFAYRGVVLGALRKYGDAFAIIASGILFGLMHGNIVQIPFAFALGCLMGYISVVSNSILPAVAIHFLNNFLSGMQEIALNMLGEKSGTIIMLASMGAALIIGIIGLAVLCKRFKHPFSPLKESVGIPLDNSIKGFLSCPGTIISYVVFGGNTIVALLSPYITSYLDGI